MSLPGLEHVNSGTYCLHAVGYPGPPLTNRGTLGRMDTNGPSIWQSSDSPARQVTATSGRVRRARVLGPREKELVARDRRYRRTRGVGVRGRFGIATAVLAGAAATAAAATAVVAGGHGTAGAATAAKAP